MVEVVRVGGEQEARVGKTDPVKLRGEKETVW